jgi:hypothetical protein
MKPKTNLLTILILLGCSLVNVYAALQECEDSQERKRADTPTKYCIKKIDNTICKVQTAGAKKREDSCLNEVGYYFFNDRDILLDSEYLEDKTSISVSVIYKCTKESEGGKTECNEIKDTDLYEVGSDKKYYINVYESNNSMNYQLIKNKCAEADNSEIERQAHLNLGISAPSTTNAIILCTKEEGCIIEDPFNGKTNLDSVVYLNSKDTLIKCIRSGGCKSSSQSEEGYFLTIGDKPLIKCELEDGTISCSLTKAEKSQYYYINSLSNKSVIYCAEEDSCEIYTPPVNSYFLNQKGETTSEAKTPALICCHSKTCKLQEEVIDNGYYLTVDREDESLYKVIHCSKAEGKMTCEIKSSVTSDGYYRNADDNTKASYPLIECDSDKGCTSLKIGKDILPGYYVDVTTGAAEILVCNENSCSSTTSSIYDKELNGNYKFDENKNLKLIIDSTADEDDEKYSGVAANNESLYYFVEVTSSGGFPGVGTNMSTLFKVTNYYIARVIENGIVYVNDNTHKVAEGGTPGTDTTIYTCNKTKKTCSISKSCVSETYLLDVQNSIGYYCNSKGEIVAIDSDGYYLDSSNGSAKKTIISCESGVCKPASSSNYYVNVGSDKSTNPLIYCNSNLCRSTTATSGYYLSSADDSSGNVGIIKCTSTTNCELINNSSIQKKEHYYLNNGTDKIQKALIKCKNRSCTTTSATDGYFMTNDSSILIFCENAVSCSTVNASAGYYNAAITADIGKKIIECTALTNVNCELKEASVGYYVAKTSNILINCFNTPCKAISVTNGIYRSATTQIISSKRETIPGENEEDGVSNEGRATTSVVYNIISCTSTGCNELTTSELLSIPVCTFSNNKCFINNRVTISTSTVSAISAGSYCTNSDRSVIYFATDTVVIDPYIIDGTTSIYTYTTTTTNCIEALEKYSENYYTVGSSIYKVSDSSITQIVNTGYYFINVETNTLVNGNNVENYNNENVKLFKCNDSSCSIVDKPETTSYYADVNKKIIQYNPNSDSYSFAYDESVICIYSNNKCTPKADIKSMEFCITYKGELALVTNDIKSRETGECYKADSISSKIYGLSQYMYVMNAFAAERVVDTAYYVISMSTNSTATIRDYDGRNNSVRVYGCQESKCDIVTPEEGVYYYDKISTYMFRYTQKKWVSPPASGYALVSVDPTDTYINRFSLNNNRTKIDGKVRTGYYFTVDKEMYECDQDKNQCEKITSNGHFFTVSGELYQCVYDSEGLEETECNKKNCIVGQYYYIDSKYYYCGSGYMLSLVSDKTCEFDDRVIINFPVAFSEHYPEKIKNAVESINQVNNSTAMVTSLNGKYVAAVSGVFTNCTYTVEEKDSEFDLVCMNNYVAVNEKTDNVEICSLAHMGYIECVNDDNNPEKCNISGTISRITKGFTFIFSLIISVLFYIYI